jgi:actin-related protein
MKINSFYKEHKDAIGHLNKFGITITVINNPSPFVLAQDSPDIVIHPESKMVKDKYPTVKFLGPDCVFPNYNYTPEFGFDSSSVTAKKSEVKSQCSLINTLGYEANEKFIKKLEEMYYLRVWGRPANCIGYMGPLDCNSYEIYNSSEVCAADNEAEILKIGYVGKMCHTPFDYMDNRVMFAENIFNKSDKARLFIDSDELFENKNWGAIFNRMLKICNERI